ncbi:DUF2079 domain-containing protein [Streptomyces cocklensis]|uniref:Predicted membrane protein n=1 Tax=Actinacidiphila cocklensis TaxID=887465 RepID=A0A9W4EC20_9ACTN|nr:DUF2079 domain-containing protein [Actinacidiphila cocklensis]MDD1057326.1 DUF2079 domain-containing protein [Actinacidiphila cocklensis]WSX79137.1 DUF2079 domain-containing protein [Streptomyces sp. NBC_00899]CAG6399394.1 Predicted membrane protein [Actinacidiphila cocklensis]
MDRAEAVIPHKSGEAAPGTASPGPSGLAGVRERFAAARLDPYLLAVAFFVAYVLLSMVRYRRMLTMSWDLGIFEQAVKGYAHLHAPTTQLKGPGFNALGDHFSPVTALIAPFYRVFPTPATLLVAQALLFALSVVPVTRGAGLLLGRGRGLAVGAAYGLSWGLQRAVDFDFHEIAFAMPLLAFSLEAVVRKRWAAAMWWALPLVLVKEDLGVTAATIGAIVWWRTRESGAQGASVPAQATAPDEEQQDGAAAGDAAGPDGAGQAGTAEGGDQVEGPLSDAERYGPWAIGLIGFGVAASALALYVLIPAFHGPGYDAFNHINGDGTMTGHIPFGTAVRTLLWILLPTSGLLALRSPLIVAAMPTIGWRFLSHYPENWGTAWHYSAVLMPVVFLAMVDAAARSRQSPRPWLRSYASGVPAAAVGAAMALTLSLPLASLGHTDTYKVDARTKAVEKVLDLIPDGATVEANVGPISRLVHRTTVYWVGGTNGVVPQYIALDNSSGWVPDPLTYGTQLHPGATYTQIANQDGYVILRRN